MKKKEDLDWQCSSTMRWGRGEEVDAYLDWDEDRYYLWFEETDNFIGWCEETLEKDGDSSQMEMLNELREELAKIGVREFYSLESVNEYCADMCGDNEPAFFYEDDLLGICGA